MIDKIVKIISQVIEITLSIIVLVAALIGMVFLYKPFLEFIHSDGSSNAFMNLLGQVLTVVIGVEFFRVLYKPQIKVLLEVLVFVLARHMIVHDLTAVEDLIVIVGIAIIVLLRYVVFFKLQNNSELTSQE